MGKKMIMVLLLANTLLVACGKNESMEQQIPTIIDTEQTNGTKEVYEVIDRVLLNIGLDKAIDLHSNQGYEDVLCDTLFLLCSTEDEKYKAYGVLSPEFGYCGIVLDVVINGEDSLNYFYDTWALDSQLPSMKIIDEKGYGCEFSFTQTIDGEKIYQRVILDSFDTGHIEQRNSGVSNYLVDAALSK